MSDESTPSDGSVDAEADTVRVAVEDDSGRVRNVEVDASFRRYLRRAHRGPVEVGDEWSEFVNGGCGTQAPVTVRVLAVESGTRVGRHTSIVLG